MTPKEIRAASEQVERETAKLAEFGQLNPHIANALRTSIASAPKQASLQPSADDIARIRRLLKAQHPSQQPQGRVVPTASPSTAKRASRRVRQIPLDEQIARRVVKRHRSSVLRFLKETGLSIGLRELIEVEMRLGKKTESDCKHAAYSARNLMEEVAEHLFPSTSETHMDRSGGKHSLGANDHKNRLIAFVEKRLEGQLEGHDFRAFVATMDAVMRWTGSGPHGACTLEHAEHSYTRMLEALAMIARANAVR